jgi:hypothetical protein
MVASGFWPRRRRDALSQLDGCSKAVTCVLAGVAGDGGAAAAVQRRQERALADDREPRVLVVQRRQELRRRVVALSARDADGALQQIVRTVVMLTSS